MKSFLKNCVKLSCSVRIYVPSTVNVDQAADTGEWVDRSLAFLSECFGGATSTKALGAWVSNNGSLVKEGVTIVFAYATQEKLEERIDNVYSFCLDMKGALSQEAIALEVNGEMYFV